MTWMSPEWFKLWTLEFSVDCRLSFSVSLLLLHNRMLQYRHTMEPLAMQFYSAFYHFLPLSSTTACFQRVLVCVFPCNMGDQVSHTNKTTKITQIRIFSLGFQTKTSSCIWYMSCLSHCLWWITLLIFGEDLRLWSLSLCNFLCLYLFVCLPTYALQH